MHDVVVVVLVGRAGDDEFGCGVGFGAAAGVETGAGGVDEAGETKVGEFDEGGVGWWEVGQGCGEEDVCEVNMSEFGKTTRRDAKRGEKRRGL